MVTWHCGNLANGILPYRLISTHNVKHMENGQFKLNMIRYLINAVYRAVEFVNLPHFGGKGMDAKQGS
eukprot:9888485-Ditylum_brightwellii.AAC.1